METRLLKRLAAALLAVMMLAGAAYAGGSTPRRDFTETATAAASSDYLIVTFKDPPAASYTGGIPGLERTQPEPGQRLNPASPAVARYKAHLARGHEEYRGYLRSKAPKAEVVRAYFLTGNALAIKLNGARAQSLAGGPGVRSVSASALYQPTMNVSTGLIRATAVWGSPGGRAGAGAEIKVGIIDSGIDDTHEFFACKGDIEHKAYASGIAGYNPAEVLVDDHGTHVAGTVAGCVTDLTTGPITGEISGVAPGAELYDYNVFPGFGAGYVAFGGSAFSHDIATALEDAVTDGMHVVNMSLGGQVQGPHDYLAEAVDATVDAGVVVVAAAGNDGPGRGTVHSPGTAPKALTVGASTNPHFVGIPVQVGDATYFAATGDFAQFGSEVTAPYTITSPENGCSTIAEDLTGQIALIDRGVCSFTTKVRSAEARHAAGVLLVNNVAGDPIAPGHDGTAMPSIPAAMLGQSDGNAMKPSGTATVTGTNETDVATGNVDIIAGFSSRGPTPFTYLIKPDVTAPGVNIYSSVFNDEWAMFQGTSMATPHVTGAVALLRQAHPDWSPADVKSALTSTADRPVWDHETGTEPTGVLVRGGGRINVASATTAPALVEPNSASFGLWNGNKAADTTLALAVRGTTNAAQTCSVAVTGGPAGLVTAPPEALEVPAGGSATLTLTLHGGQADKTPSDDYSGDVELTCSGQTLLVPWWVQVDRQGKP